MNSSVESLLTELAGHIDWPEHADQVPAIRHRLASASTRRSRRRWIPVTAVVVVLVAALLLLSPSAREAVADLLGVAGIEVQFDPEPPPAAGSELDLGEPVTLDEAHEAVDFELLVPENLGPPDGVFLSDRPSSGRVSMVWESEESLPAAGDSGIGLIYSQFALELPEGSNFVKSVRPDTSVRAVEVNGSLGLWIEGAPHLITYEDAAGNRTEEEMRLAGNVLMWESDGVTHRIETTVGLQATLSLAGSLERLDDGRDRVRPPGPSPRQSGLNSGQISATMWVFSPPGTEVFAWDRWSRSGARRCRSTNTASVSRRIATSGSDFVKGPADAGPFSSPPRKDSPSGPSGHLPQRRFAPGGGDAIGPAGISRSLRPDGRRGRRRLPARAVPRIPRARRCLRWRRRRSIGTGGTLRPGPRCRV